MPQADTLVDGHALHVGGDAAPAGAVSAGGPAAQRRESRPAERWAGVGEHALQVVRRVPGQRRHQLEVGRLSWASHPELSPEVTRAKVIGRGESGQVSWRRERQSGGATFVVVMQTADVCLANSKIREDFLPVSRSW